MQERNAEMNMAWQFIADTHVSVFLTGVAGTGKTTFLRKLRERMPKRMVVLAPTGVAAINAGGQTIHSFFQLPFGPFVPGTKSDKRDAYKMSQKKKDMIRTLDLLVIDEISMVRADLLDQIDDALRKYRDPVLPFGGVQLLLIGDLMQLAPVSKDKEWSMLSQYYATPYFFSSRALGNTRYVTIELKKIYRQQDDNFISLLGHVRNGNITPDVVEKLNARYMPDFDSRQSGWIRLTTHNASAQQYNDQRLRELPGEMHIFKAKIDKDFPEISYPTDETLSLKIGAQVMFVKNDLSPFHEYYNGKIGTIVGFNADTIVVYCQGDEENIAVHPTQWDNTKYTIDPETKAIKEEVQGTFTQYPLRLAWAITVHKSQGLTFDHAVLDINSSFAHGQVYVALSRCRTLEGLVLSSPLSLRSVITDQSVNQYIQGELAAVGQSIEHLPQYKADYALMLLDELYNFQSILAGIRWLARVIDEHLSRQQPMLLQQLKALDAPFAKDVCDVAQRFRMVYAPALAAASGKIEGTPLEQRIKQSSMYFVDKLKALAETGLKGTAINIENKATAQIYNNALEALRGDLRCKVEIFQKLAEAPFSIQNYLNFKAESYLNGTEWNVKKKVAKREKLRKKTIVVADEGHDYMADEPMAEMQKPQKQKKEKAPKEPKPKKPNTLEETFVLSEQGLSVAEIAAKRGLVETTIYGHLAALVGQGRIPASRYVSAERCQKILEVAASFTQSYTLTELKQLLPEDYSFGEIKIALVNPSKSPE